jgi:hypothetical protein
VATGLGSLRSLPWCGLDGWLRHELGFVSGEHRQEIRVAHCRDFVGLIPGSWLAGNDKLVFSVRIVRGL